MGVVFEALDTRLDRRVAVKVLQPELATEIAAERFRREARLMARFRHPCVVQVHDVGEADGLSWFIMDLVRGETLAARLARGPLGTRETLNLGRDLLSALAEAHEQGIVHRDIKPANIFIEKGRALLSDFGIARTATTSGTDAGLTATQAMLGTPRYMSPEQHSGGDVGPASDQFALALVLYECLSGKSWPQLQSPEKGDWSKVPSELAPALKRAMAFEPEGRWADAAQLATALGASRVNLRWVWTAAVAVVVTGLAWFGYLRWKERSGCPAEASSPYSPGIATTVPCEQYEAWLDAERVFGTGNWQAAEAAYRSLRTANPGCLACEYRLMEVDRWLERSPDTARIGRLTNAIGSFGQPWQELISASLSPARTRIDRFDDLTNKYRDWPFAWYALGTELFNRGSFFGRSRSDAISALSQHAALDREFVPAWTDRTLASIAAGDSAAADSALTRLRALPPVGGLAQAQRLLAGIAFAFRFTPYGLHAWEDASRDSSVRSGRREVAAGPRVLSGLGTPRGAVDLGRAFEKTGVMSLQRSGLIAEMLGSIALGRIDSARAAGRRLNAMFPSNEFLAFDAMLRAAVVLLDAETTASEAADVEAGLRHFTRPMMPPGVRRDALWLSALAAIIRKDPAAGRAALRLLADEPQPAFRRILIEGALLAASGAPDSAIAHTDVLATDLEGWDRAERSPLLRAAARLSRAQWFAATGVPENARSEYRWYQHFHLPDYPVDNPLPADGDWTFSTLASWRQARLLDHGATADAADLEVCAAYGTVVDRWSLGDARSRARADTARARLASLRCDHS
jgi:serine/threonine protein kinase